MLTDANGDFEIDTYTCPSPASQLYLVSIAGNPGLSAGANNPNLAEMAVLGPCSSITASTQVVINEVTTVAAVYGLAPFMTSYSAIGAGAAQWESLTEGVTLANELANSANGTSPGPALPAGQVVPVQRLQTLANIVSACINSLGGVASDGSPCGDLFLYSNVTSNTAVPDTIQAILEIAREPTWNVAQIFSLSGWMAPFQPSIATAPADWTLAVASAIPTPVILPVSGTYSSNTLVTITDATPASQLYYTTDGTPPSASSTPYTGPFTITASTVIRAVALAAGLPSLDAQASYGVTVGHLAFVTAPSTSTVGVGVSPSPTVAVEDTTGTVLTTYSGPITVQLGSNPGNAMLSGTLTVNAVNGQAAFPNLNLSAAGYGYTLMANSPGLTSATSTSFAVNAPAGATYYLAPNGNDANDGSSPGKAWLSPNHNVVCGDVIVAVASAAYSPGNFGGGQWGKVNCPSGDNIAWLKCASFDACKITVPANVQAFGMNVSESYWGVQGWEIYSPGLLANGLSCFNASPASNNATIHHIIFANNVATTCPLAGFGMGTVYNGTASVDYYVAIGNISYNAGTSNTGCGSGIDVYMPAASDSAAGTHIYVAGNFVWSSVNPQGCWDGNGIIFDTFDGRGTEPVPYSQQAVIDNNVSLSNAGVGVRVEYNNAGNAGSHATVFARHNTTWNNSISPYQFGSPDCGEVQLYQTQNTTVTQNLAVTSESGCYGAFWNPLSAYSVNQSDATNTVSNNVGWSDYGYYSQLLNVAGFSYSQDNLFGVNPAYTSASTPSAPTCGNFSSVPSCMASVVANFQPTNSSVAAYGYQIPSSTPVADALFPKWVCNVHLPSGLVTMGCL